MEVISHPYKADTDKLSLLLGEPLIQINRTTFALVREKDIGLSSGDLTAGAASTNTSGGTPFPNEGNTYYLMLLLSFNIYLLFCVV